MNLDGARSSRGHYIGSFDWRYFLTEEGSGASMPRVSINVMHEIVYGCVWLVRSIDKETIGRGCHLQLATPIEKIESLPRLANGPDELTGVGQEGDRLEILWGPDYGDRYDYLVFEGDRIRSFFATSAKCREN